MAKRSATRRRKEGGRRKTRKLSSWNKFVKEVYHRMKRKDSSATFSDALKQASKERKGH